MDTILLIVLAILVVFFSFIIIRSWLLQRQFKDSLHLNSTKNSSVLLKQTSGLLVSVVVFVVLLNNSSYFIPKQNDAAPTNSDQSGALEAVERYQQEFQKDGDYSSSSEITILGEVTLSDKKTYTLVWVDDTYFLIEQDTNTVIEFLPNP